jgi:hypothetical protein
VSGWTVVKTVEDLACWVTARGLVDVLAPRLLRDHTVRILRCEREPDVLAGAILNRTGPVVGISNVFSQGMALDEVWDELGDFSAHEFPSLPVVGYARGENLNAALAVGFAALAPLRIWLQRQ